MRTSCTDRMPTLDSSKTSESKTVFIYFAEKYYSKSLNLLLTNHHLVSNQAAKTRQVKKVSLVMICLQWEELQPEQENQLSLIEKILPTTYQLSLLKLY